MHELSITQNMLDIVLEKAREEKATEVKKISLVIGEMTGYVEDCVRFHFDFLSKGSIAEGAELLFKNIPARARCRNCSQTFEIDETAWLCPHCRGESLEIIAGRELFIESIEVE